MAFALYTNKDDRPVVCARRGGGASVNSTQVRKRIGYRAKDVTLHKRLLQVGSTTDLISTQHKVGAVSLIILAILKE